MTIVGPEGPTLLGWSHGPGVLLLYFNITLDHFFIKWKFRPSELIRCRILLGGGR